MGTSGGVHSHIFEQIISLENLFEAWFDCIKGKRSRIDVQHFARDLEKHIFSLHDDLQKGTWCHGTYEHFRVADPKPRQIHKASVADRIVHHAIVRVIEPLFERSFIYDSWSCRIEKGTHASVVRLHSDLERFRRSHRGHVWVLKCDVKSFFASIDHDILFQIIQKKVQEERASSLIRNVIDSYDPGMPLGNLTSQLFANIYMNAFDHYVQEQFSVFRYMRYSDDFLLVHDDHAYLHACISRIADYLASERHLVLHPHKIVLKRFDQGIDWLGYVLYPGYRLIRSSTKKRMWRHIDKTVSEYVDGTVSLETLKSMLSSYLGLVYVSNENNEKKLLYTLLSSL